MKRIIGGVKQLVRGTDFFYSTEMLRYDQDLQYKTLTGGIISLGIIITIFVGFANMIFNTLDLNTFNISTQIIKNPVPTASVLEITEDSTFRFAIQIWRQNLSDTKRYFDINFAEVTQNYGQITNISYIPLETCTKQYFKNYPQMVKSFDTLESGKWLCPPMNTFLHFEGKYSSQYYVQNYLRVSVCHNSTDPSRPCASIEQIEQYFKDNYDFFYFTVYFTNTQVNPDKKDYLQTYLQDKSYATFGRNLGSENFLYFTDYTVSTDQSILPFASVKTDTGCLAQSLVINHPFQTNINSTYISFSIAKSSNSIVYTREVQKLSAVFSFMGGMIGAVSAVLFVIKIYTSLSFEFSIAFQIFKKKEEAQQIIEDGSGPKGKQKSSTTQETGQISMNFFNFIRYYLYTLCQNIGFSYTWPEMDYAEECKQEILKQLDIKLLLKRIIFMEHCLTYIIDDYQLDALQINKPKTPKEIKELRLKCESIVDQQMSTQKTIRSDQEQKEISVYNQQQTHQSPNILMQNTISKKLFEFKQRKKNNQTELQKYQKGRDSIRQQMKNGVLKMDMDRMRDQISHQTFAKSKGKNQVHDSHKRQKMRKSFLITLQENAKEGNSISSKIWRHLDENIKKSVKHI